MDLRDSPGEARFRAEVHAWLEASLPPGWGTPDYEAPRTGEERVAFMKRWQRTLYDGGWAGLTWPREFGGREVSVIEALIWGEEYARVRGPDMTNLSVGTSLTGPTVMVHGTPAQKARFLQPILKGEEVWCQGFSEPNAGSDLAGLRTRGVVEDDAIVVTGQKIWTSFAQYADWCILVVRTDPGSVRHRGLTFLLCPMGLPGMDVRPLREMTGEAWFNEVFFDGVRVPREHVLGEIGRGWDVVITTLTVERGATAPYARPAAELQQLVELARRRPYLGCASALEHPVVRQKLAQLAIDVAVLRMNAYRDASRVQRTGHPGPEGSTLKLFWSELDQRLMDLAIELLGDDGLVEEGDPAAVEDGVWSHGLLWSRASTIYAGTSEIQRNIIAQRVLGLPRGR